MLSVACSTTQQQVTSKMSKNSVQKINVPHSTCYLTFTCCLLCMVYRGTCHYTDIHVGYDLHGATKVRHVIRRFIATELTIRQFMYHCHASLLLFTLSSLKRQMRHEIANQVHLRS